MRIFTISVLVLFVALLPGLLLSPVFGDTGSERFASGDYAGAVDWYEQALLTAPQEDRAVLYNNLGVMYSALGDDEKAMEAFTTAIEVDPTYGRGYLNLGSRYEQSGEIDKALEWYLKAVDMDPSVFSEAMGNAGDMYVRVGKYDDAVTAYIRAGPDAVESVKADIYNGLGAVYMLRNRTDDAEEAFLTAIEADPDGAALAHTNLGVLRVSQGRYTEAKDEFRTAAQRDLGGITQARQYLQSLEQMVPEQNENESRDNHES